MAPIAKTIALAGALYSVLGFAAPMQKRAVVWETVTDIVWTTIDVTTTLYPQQLDAATATVAPVTTAAPAVAAVTTTQAAQQQQAQKEAEPEPTSSSSTSTVAPAPAPAPTEQPTQAPAPPAAVPTTSAAPSSTSEAPAPASSSSSSSSSQGSGYDGSCDESSPCTGQMTYYDTATTSTNPSACGTTNDGETEFVLALPHGIMTDGDCGKSVTIEYNGVTKTGTVVDKCMGCDNTSIDLSRALFGAFASLSEGRLSGAKWYIN
ncbi:uncharacterized protein N7498_010063 [Penicillium cinerascens]|uniref:Allergen Asp f 7 n=1 Tax=Penicillium cinerascens TaxID=70096 RepID=A0A9W9M6U7_9EURO|nr:uncharacterized protein N7498_010063 [Penicillium cinerascens]KAJ5191078.1 hypothetical protein N7498_010063 [Penicillium cinerascens]